MAQAGGAGARHRRKLDLAARTGSAHDAPALPAMMPSFACPALRELVVAVGNGTHVGLSVKLPVMPRDLARGVVCIPIMSLRGVRHPYAQRHRHPYVQRHAPTFKTNCETARKSRALVHDAAKGADARPLRHCQCFSTYALSCKPSQQTSAQFRMNARDRVFCMLPQSTRYFAHISQGKPVTEPHGAPSSGAGQRIVTSFV